ncbi:MAG: T9SS type A sorting domain-containing protein [Candidatus Kapaibacterium sp.]
MKTILKILLLLLLTTPLYSQKEYNQWVIGYKYFIDFNTPDGSPTLSDLHTLLPSPLNTFAGNSYTRRPSLFCKNDGSLNLFSIGNYLFNSSDEFLENPDNIMGGKRIQQSMTDNYGNVFNYWELNTEIQNTIFVKAGRKIIRLINHNNSDDYLKILPNIISYDVFVDDSIIKKNQIVNENYNSESLYAIKNFTNDNYWLIGYDDRSQNYICYEVDSNGVNNNIHSMYNSELIDETATFCYSRIIKSSPNGQYLLLSVECYDENIKHEKSKADSYYELLEFNPLTGEFVRKIDNFYLGCSVEMEFSMNSRYIYFMTNESFYQSSGTGNSIIFQYDLYKEKSNGPILNNTEYYSTMQLAPNGKIYFSKNSSITFSNNKIINNSVNPLLEINNPELPAEKISIKSLRFKTDSLRYLWSLPNIPTSQYLRVYTKSKFEICENEKVQLESFVIYPQADTIYSWTGPNGFISDEQNPLLKNLTKADEGIYIVTVNGGEEPYTAETYVKVNESPNPIILKKPDKKLCVGSELILSTEKEYEHYLWSTGDTTPVTRVYKSGTYSISVIDTFGCEGTSTIDIVFYGDSELAIEGDTIKCKGESVTLTCIEEFPEYKWSNGETTRSITVTNPARYTLTVKTEEGCTVTRTIEVKDHPKVNAELKPTPTTICKGDSTLLESKFTPLNYSYEWNTGATTKGIYVSESGNYKLIITDTRTGCTDSTEIAIKVEDNLKPEIDGGDICSGESATLEVLPNDPSYTYKWSNGEETPVIQVNQAGTYSVTVSKAGCTGTAETIVNESPQPEFEIQGESIICNNESATLTADKDFEEYLWSTNEITKSIEVTEAGTYTLTVTDENGCQATETHKVEKYELNFTISNSTIDFGKVYISETKTDRATLTNNSGFAITLENGEMVQNGHIYEINYDFTPTDLGFFGDDISVHIIEPCDTTVVIPITARVYARTTISTEDIYTQIGQTETVPVYIECEADLQVQEYSITTDIDRTAFFTNDSYTINQTQPISKLKTKVHELTGTILLSDDLEYDITFPSYTFTNPYIEVIEQPGKIFIDSVCVFDFRNIQLVDPTTLDISPNPASEQLNIDITTGVQGSMKLELVATDGRVIYSDEWMQSTKSKQMKINTINIPSGLYQVRLITPYDAITKSVIVVE